MRRVLDDDVVRRAKRVDLFWVVRSIQSDDGDGGQEEGEITNK